MNPATSTSVDSNVQIKQATSTFIKEMTDLIQQAILETVNDALQKVSVGPSVRQLTERSSKKKLAGRASRALPKRSSLRLSSPKTLQLTSGSAKGRTIRIKGSDGSFNMVLPDGKFVKRSRRRELVKIAKDLGYSAE